MTEGKREKRSKHSDEGIVARLQDACGGMAFAEVARVTGVKPESARRYLIGSTPATVRFLRNLCVAYDLSFEWLNFGELPMRRSQVDAARLANVSIPQLLRALADAFERDAKRGR